MKCQSVRVSEYQGEKGYKKLKVWQKAHALGMEIYRTTKRFPREELYGITSQIRRSALSIPINIVEGQASNSKREFLSFLNIANRSLVETEYLLEICLKLNFIDQRTYDRLENMRRETGFVLNAFTRSIRTKL